MKKEDPEVQEFLDRFEEEAIPKIRASAFTVGILNTEVDAKLCLEIGASVLLDKPLVMLVARGTFIPVNLKKIAARIIEVNWPMDAADQEATLEAIRKIASDVDRAQQ